MANSGTITSVISMMRTIGANRSFVMEKRHSIGNFVDYKSIDITINNGEQYTFAADNYIALFIASPATAVFTFTDDADATHSFTKTLVGNFLYTGKVSILFNKAVDDPITLAWKLSAVYA